MSTQPLTKPQETAVPRTIKSWLASDYFKQQVALCLPKHLTADRFVRVAISALGRIPKLQKCTPESVMRCMMTCSELGIEPDGRRAHLIPFGQECTLIIDYKGLVELAKRSGDVSNIHAEVICQNDAFSYNTGDVTHEIDFRKPRGEMYAVYCVINFKDGGKHTEVMTREDVDRIRKRSRASSNGPWVTDYEEMAKKTVFRRASKWLTLSPEIYDALDKEDEGPRPAIVSEGIMALPELTEEAEPEAIVAAAAPPNPEEFPKPIREALQAAETPSGPGPDSPQSKLAAIVIEAGFTFDDLIRWARREGHITDAQGDIPDFASMPYQIANRLARAKTGLIAGLAKEAPNAS